MLSKKTLSTSSPTDADRADKINNEVFRFLDRRVRGFAKTIEDEVAAGDKPTILAALDAEVITALGVLTGAVTAHTSTARTNPLV